MATFIVVDKISEEKEENILTSIFKCTFFNYKDFLTAANRRQFFEEEIEIARDIRGTLKIYPTGVSKEVDGFISIFVGVVCEGFNMIPLRVSVSILDTELDSTYIHSDNEFKWVTAGTLIGVSIMIPSDIFFDEEGCNLIDDGCLTIFVTISIEMEMFLTPLLGEPYTKIHQDPPKDPTDNRWTSDTVLSIGNEKVDVNKGVLIRGSPAFSNFFEETTPIDGCYNMTDRDPTEVALDILICNMKDYDGSDLNQSRYT